MDRYVTAFLRKHYAERAKIFQKWAEFAELFKFYLKEKALIYYRLIIDCLDDSGNKAGLF